jgi:GDP-D-mannose 3', 5'-epimerase
MNLKGQKAVVCGAGGFIGGHLVQNLLANGVEVIRAVDVKPLDEWYQASNDVENLSLDLKDKDNCLKAAEDANVIFQLAADMGGMGSSRTTKPSAC